MGSSAVPLVSKTLIWNLPLEHKDAYTWKVPRRNQPYVLDRSKDCLRRSQVEERPIDFCNKTAKSLPLLRYFRFFSMGVVFSFSIVLNCYLLMNKRGCLRPAIHGPGESCWVSNCGIPLTQLWWSLWSDWFTEVGEVMPVAQCRAWCIERKNDIKLNEA